MDYDVQMLKLYFKEKNMTIEQINHLLNDNPFNSNYVKWEKQTLNSNKTFCIALKRNNLVNKNNKILEVTNHRMNSVSKYLENDIYYSINPINTDISNLRANGDLLIIRGIYPGQEELLKKVRNKPFITGICSRDKNLYEYMKMKYTLMNDEIENSDLIELTNNDSKIIILRRQ